MVSFVFGRVFSKGTDDGTKSEQRGVDVFAFASAIFGRSSFFGPCKVDEALYYYYFEVRWLYFWIN